MLASLTYFREPHAHRDYYRLDHDDDTIVSRTYDAHAPCRVCHTLISHTHGTSGRGVATDRGPVTNARIVAYALCSKNVVHVNEAKLPHGGCMHQGHFSSYVAPFPLKPPSFLFLLVSQPIAPNYSPKSTLAFLYQFFKSVNNKKKI